MNDAFSKDIIHIHIHASPPDGEGHTGIAAVVTRNGDDPDSVLLAVGRKTDAASECGAFLRALLMALEEIPTDGTKIELYSDSNWVQLFAQDYSFPLLEEKQTAERIRKRILSKDLTVTFHQDDAVMEFLQKLADRAYREGAFRIRYSTTQPQG